MPDAIDTIVDSFPHPTLTAIEGIPSFATIRQIQVELNANASSIHSNLGDGQLGLLFLTVSQATYESLSDVPLKILAQFQSSPGAVLHVRLLMLNFNMRKRNVCSMNI